MSRAARSSDSSVRRSSRVGWSRADRGSSRSSRLGWMARARARATRWRSPPDSDRGDRPASGVMPRRWSVKTAQTAREPDADRMSDRLAAGSRTIRPAVCRAGCTARSHIRGDGPTRHCGHGSHLPLREPARLPGQPQPRAVPGAVRVTHDLPPRAQRNFVPDSPGTTGGRRRPDGSSDAIAGRPPDARCPVYTRSHPQMRTTVFTGREAVGAMSLRAGGRQNVRGP